MNFAQDNQDTEQQETALRIPSQPGPAVLGFTPLLGSIRRSVGVPVLRDNLLSEGFLAGQSDDFANLPDNVVVSTENPDDEQIRIANERSDEFKRIILMDGGKVEGVGQGSGGSVVLREFQDQEFTLDREIVTEPREESGPAETKPASVPSMSRAGTEKREQKRGAIE